MARIAVLVSNPCTGDARVIKMASAAARQGHEVNVLATTAPGVPPFETIDGVTYHRVEWKAAKLLTEGPVLGLVSAVSKKLASALARAIAPYVKYRLFSSVFASHTAGLEPHIIHAHDLICLPAAFEAARQCGAKVVYDAHELEVHRHPPQPILQRCFVGYVERKYARRAAAVITVGKLVRDELQKSLGRHDIHVIYNSPIIEPCRDNLRKDLRVAEHEKIILYVGKVTVGRGIEDLIAMLPELPGAIVAAVGPADARTASKLRTQAERLEVVGRFKMLPAVPFSEVVSYIQGADIGIISSEVVALSYKYAMPNKLLEMSFANVPIISNTLLEIQQFLQTFQNGVTVDFDKRESLVYEISKFLANRESYVMDGATYERMSAEYSWAEQARKLESIYANLSPQRENRSGA